MSLSDIGYFFTLATFLLSLYGLIAAYLSTVTPRSSFLIQAVRASTAAFYVLSLSSLLLLYQFYLSDFNNAFVAGHSNYDLHIFYRLTALWAGESGGILVWLWLQFALIVTVNKLYFQQGPITVLKPLWQKGKSTDQSNANYNSLFPYVLTILMINGLFFAFISFFGTNPFQVLNWHAASGEITAFIARDGNGLNPLLQHPAMIFHPPTLYIGFVGFSVPFSFAIAALWTRELGERWVTTIRRWTLGTWFFLTLGIILGGYWAYVELGWGGYWAWDPVENGSFLPWLTATAFLHSVIVQEKRGMLKIWNVSLILVTYILVIFSTTITRSGAISSVHAFGNSKVAPIFTTFLTVLCLISVYMVVTRVKLLKSEHKLDSFISRESAVVFNNLVFFTFALAVFLGTIFPILSELFVSQKITVGPSFFNQLARPIGVVLLLLTGLGPILAWRKTSTDSLLRNLFLPAIALVVTVVVMLIMGVSDFYALALVGLSVFVAVGVCVEFYRGIRSRVIGHKEPAIIALAHILKMNQRRYGGYIVHLGVILMFVGFAGNFFNQETIAKKKEGESFVIGQYDVQVKGIISGKTKNYAFSKLALDISREGEKIGTIFPEKRNYFASNQNTTEIAVHHAISRDLYVVFDGATNLNENNNTKPEYLYQVHVWIKPFVSLLWIGGFIMLLGTIVTIIPWKKARAAVQADDPDIASGDFSDGNYHLLELLEKKTSYAENIRDLNLDWQMGKFSTVDFERMREEYLASIKNIEQEIVMAKKKGVFDFNIRDQKTAMAYIDREVQRLLVKDQTKDEIKNETKYESKAVSHEKAESLGKERADDNARGQISQTMSVSQAAVSQEETQSRDIDADSGVKAEAIEVSSETTLELEGVKIDSVDSPLGDAPGQPALLENQPEIGDDYSTPEITQSDDSPRAQSKNFCSQCGNRLMPADKFCSNCGHKI